MSNVTSFLIIVAVVSGVVALLMFFVFRVPHLVFVLTGIGARREIRRIARGELQSRAPSAVISFDETTILSEEQRNETTVLTEDALVDEVQTIPGRKSPFRVKKDVVIKKGEKEVRD